MGTAMFAVALAIFFACYAVAAHHDCHMFQLNSYKPDVHLRWLKKNWIRDWLPSHAAGFVSLAALVFTPFAAAAVTNVAYLAQAWRDRPAPKKKPLVYTNRVKRLLATNAVLVLLVVLLAWFLGPFYGLVPPALAFLASPLLLLLANRANAPLEKAVNGRYLKDAATRLAASPDLVVVGVTGSYGKTSVKHFLGRILSEKYNVLVSPGNFNTTLGAVRTVREELRPFHQIFVCEMGARNVGDIKEICELVKPKYGVVTSIGPQHLESFKTLDAVAQTKFELVRALPPDGVAFLNASDEIVRAQPCDGPTATYAIAGSDGTGDGADAADGVKADYVARNIEVTPHGSTFSAVLSDGGERRFETRLLGRHNVLNVIGAVAVADRLGVPPASIQLAVRRLEAPPHRLQLLNRGGLTIIDDAYNANVEGAKAALSVLAMLDGHRILVTPGLVELGEVEDRENFNFGVQAAAVCGHVVLVGERQTRKIREGLRSAGFPETSMWVAETVDEAFKQVRSLDAKGERKVVLIENDLPDNY